MAPPWDCIRSSEVGVDCSRLSKPLTAAKNRIVKVESYGKALDGYFDGCASRAPAGKS